MNPQRTRNLGAVLAIQCCNGGLYAWSAFVPALNADYGLSFTQLALIFSTTVACFTGTMVLAGPVQERRGPRDVVLLSAALFTLGYLTAAHSQGSFLALLLGLGVLGGAAIGLGYVTALGTCARWFPNQCGLVTGVVVAAFGGSGLFIAQLAEARLAQGTDVLALLGQIGLICAVIVAGSGLLLSTPDPGRGPVEPHRLRRPTEVFADPGTQALAVGMFAGTFGGLLVISHLSPLVLSLGGSPHTATWSVGAFALGNAAGRILWGRLADRIGQTSIPWSLALLAGALLSLWASTTPGALLVASALLGVCFGAAFVVHAAQVARDHGPAGLGLVYPWVFLCYGLAGIAGPAMGGWIADAFGDYRLATLVAAAVAATAVPLTVLLRRRAGAASVAGAPPHPSQITVICPPFPGQRDGSGSAGQTTGDCLPTAPRSAPARSRASELASGGVKRRRSRSARRLVASRPAHSVSGRQGPVRRR